MICPSLDFWLFFGSFLKFLCVQWYLALDCIASWNKMIMTDMWLIENWKLLNHWSNHKAKYVKANKASLAIPLPHWALKQDGSCALHFYFVNNNTCYYEIPLFFAYFWSHFLFLSLYSTKMSSNINSFFYNGLFPFDKHTCTAIYKDDGMQKQSHKSVLHSPLIFMISPICMMYIRRLVNMSKLT